MKQLAYSPKFRAWHKELKQMYDVIRIETRTFDDNLMLGLCLPNSLAGHLSDVPSECTELMQWTGLQDCNGKDIYEGDILKIEDLETEIGTVQFSYGGFWVEGLETEYCGIACIADCPDYKTEVIGNIYETPELMQS